MGRISAIKKIPEFKSLSGKNKLVILKSFLSTYIDDYNELSDEDKKRVERDVIEFYGIEKKVEKKAEKKIEKKIEKKVKADIRTIQKIVKAPPKPDMLEINIKKVLKAVADNRVDVTPKIEELSKKVSVSKNEIAKVSKEIKNLSEKVSQKSKWEFNVERDHRELIQGITVKEI